MTGQLCSSKPFTIPPTQMPKVTAWAVIGKEGGTVEIFSPLVDTGNIGLLEMWRGSVAAWVGGCMGGLPGVAITRSSVIVLCGHVKVGKTRSHLFCELS